MCTRPELLRLSPDTRRQAGVSMVELVMFIVIVGISVTGILLVMNKVTAHSADPLVHKQSLEIAQSLLEEIELMPMTYCDPNDPNAASAVNDTVGPGGCAQWSENVTVGPVPSSEKRGNVSDPYDNVADYGAYSMNSGNGGIVDAAGNPVVGLSGYQASVTLARAGGGGNFLGGGLIEDALRITVTVTGPDNSQVVLDGYRTRYAPNGQ